MCLISTLYVACIILYVKITMYTAPTPIPGPHPTTKPKTADITLETITDLQSAGELEIITCGLFDSRNTTRRKTTCERR